VLLEGDAKADPPQMDFFRWFLEESEHEDGVPDEVAEIIKNQLFVNPLQFMDGEGEDPQVGVLPALQKAPLVLKMDVVVREGGRRRETWQTSSAAKAYHVEEDALCSILSAL